MLIIRTPDIHQLRKRSTTNLTYHLYPDLLVSLCSFLMDRTNGVGDEVHVD